MEWIDNLFFSSGVAQSIIILALVITSGILLSKIRIAGISFGVTWILFTGIAFSHWGLSVESHILHFVKEFGLILFVFSIGLQVGPGFFSSLKKGGLKLNLFALMIVLLGVAVTLVIKYATDLPIPTMTGIMSGAVTNTPGLGAAQQTWLDMQGAQDPSIATGYAIAYPVGVIGIILSLIIIKKIFSVNIENEKRILTISDDENPEQTVKFSVTVTNRALFGKSIKEIKAHFGMDYVVSRVCNTDGKVQIAQANVALTEGSKILVVASRCNRDSITALYGQEHEFRDEEWNLDDNNVTLRRMLVTHKKIHGRSLAELKLGKAFGITVTRVNRAGVDLLAKPDLRLQMGDRLTVVGSPSGLESVSKLMGNSIKQLREPNLIAIFLGIALGIIFGSIPFVIPGIPQPVKLGLAGGPLIVAILMSKFGPRFKLVTFTTMSANLMLREVGISLFLACVGLDAGRSFVDTLVYGGGLLWMAYAAAITVIPLLITGIIARLWAKLDYFSIIGMMAGSTTDPPALAYSGAVTGSDLPAVSYATVYPLTMFLRVLMAQLLILMG
ncbi:MAG: putative transporter [Bacteroidales bacterium]|nr:putative transporter [Bacteroidales bacterium]